MTKLKNDYIGEASFDWRFMNNCKYLKQEDTTPWHGDVFDHPTYIFICKKNGREVSQSLHCKRCKKYCKENEDNVSNKCKNY